MRWLLGVGLLLAWAGSLAQAQGVLMVTPGRNIGTLTGTGIAGYSGDGSNASSAAVAHPSAVAYDSAGNLYFADSNNHVVREVSPSGFITTVAGTGAAGYGGDGGPATAAFLDTPTGIAIDPQGNLFIADAHNHRIRKVSGGQITTVAGTGVAGFSGDGGSATGAQLALPSAVSVDASGNLFIADTNNQRVRKVSAGVITTVAGNGEELFAGDGGAAVSASLDQPTGLAIDAAGNLYIADKNNQRVRLVNVAGVISTAVGNGAGVFSGSFGGDGGSADTASLAKPRSLSVDAAGNLFVADTNNQRVRQIGSNGVITTASGSGEQGFGGDGGPATGALLNTPQAVTTDANGTVVIADTHNERVRSTLPGKLDFGSQATGTASAPQQVTLSNTGASSLIISSLAFQGPFNPAAGGTCSVLPVSLAPGASCTQAVIFQPIAAGQAGGSLTVGGQNLVSQVVRLTGSAASVGTSLLLAADKLSILSGETVTLSATLSGPGGPAQSATGNIMFYAGSQLLGTAPLSSGKASFSIGSLADGTASLKAVFAGSMSFGSSTSPVITENVADLSLSFAALQVPTVVPGQAIAVPVTLLTSGASGLTSTVTLGTSQIASGLTISFAPATSVLVNGQLPFTMKVLAAPASAAMTPNLRENTGSGIALALLLLPLSPMGRGRRRRSLKSFSAIALLLLGSAALMGGLTGCGSNTGFFGQKQQTYNITVTATATDNTGGSLIRTTVVPITVQ